MRIIWKRGIWYEFDGFWFENYVSLLKGVTKSTNSKSDVDDYLAEDELI